MDIEPLAYIRTNDGFVTNMHEVAAETQEGSNRYRVPFFNPGKNRNQESHLRLINPGSSTATIEIIGVDDQGQGAHGGPVRLSLGAGRARMLSAEQLEMGTSGTSGRLGAPSGKWRLEVSADRPLQVMSLLTLPTGHLTNLSRGWEGVPGSTLRPPSAGKPDLVVQAPSLSTSSRTVQPGQSFTLRATVRNQGAGQSDATRLRAYRSSSATISRSATELASTGVGALPPSGSSTRTLTLTAPGVNGTDYYGACVDSVSEESDAINNCSSSVGATVTGSSTRVGVIAFGWQGQSCADGFGWTVELDATGRDRAIAQAESACRGFGLNNCGWAGWFTQCGALAYGVSGSRCGREAGWGTTQRAAEQHALANCRERFGSCRIPVGRNSGERASYCNTGSGTTAPSERQGQLGGANAGLPFVPEAGERESQGVSIPMRQ